MNPFTSLRAPIDAEEEMDAVELAPARYAKVLADLSRINALTLAARPTRGFLDRVAARGVGAQPWRILDVGFGSGDMLARIDRWGTKRGVLLDLVGIDLNPKSAPVAEARLGGLKPVPFSVPLVAQPGVIRRDSAHTALINSALLRRDTLNQSADNARYFFEARRGGPCHRERLV